MAKKSQDEIVHDHNNDGIDRRGFLKCMAWAGTGALCVMEGGVLKSYSMSRLGEIGAREMAGELSFVQISDSHMGFNKPANPDVAATLQAAVDKINGLAEPPEFLLHTGDISHLSKPEEFDTVDQILKSASAKDVFFVPGEHDVLDDDGKSYLERYGKNAQGRWMVQLRQERRALHRAGERDESEGRRTGHARAASNWNGWKTTCKHLKHSTPIVVFAHIPLWTVYPGLGLGHGRQRAGAGLPEEVRFGDGAERTHPPDHAEGRRKRDISYRDVDGISATAAGQSGFAGTDESAGGAVEECAGNYGCQLRARPATLWRWSTRR